MRVDVCGPGPPAGGSKPMICRALGKGDGTADGLGASGIGRGASASEPSPAAVRRTIDCGGALAPATHTTAREADHASTNALA